MRMGLRWHVTRFLRVDRAAKGIAVDQRVELDDGVSAVEAHMHLVCVHACHHMDWGMTDGNGPYLIACNAIEDRQIVAKPLGLVDDQLIPVGPHVVGVIHVDFWQGNPLGDFPRAGVQSNCGAWLSLVFCFFSNSASTQISPTPGWRVEGSVGPSKWVSCP